MSATMTRAGQELTKGGDGFKIYEGFAPAKDERIFEKTVNSPFRESGRREYLASRGEKCLIAEAYQRLFFI